MHVICWVSLTPSTPTPGKPIIPLNERHWLSSITEGVVNLSPPCTRINHLVRGLSGHSIGAAGCELKQIKPGWKKGTETFLVDVCGPERAEVERSLCGAWCDADKLTRAFWHVQRVGVLGSRLFLQLRGVKGQIRERAGRLTVEWEGRRKDMRHGVEVLFCILWLCWGQWGKVQSPRSTVEEMLRIKISFYDIRHSLGLEVHVIKVEGSKVKVTVMPQITLWAMT